MYAIDGRETWLIHNYLNPEERDFDSVDRDRSIRAILGVGPDFDYEILSKEDWVGRRLVADRFRDRPRLHLRRRGAPLGAVCRLRHECRHRRCGEPLLAARRALQRLGRRRHPRRATRPSACRSPSRCRIFAMNQALRCCGAAPQPCHAEIETPGPRRRRGARRARPGRLRAQRAAVLLRRAQLRLLLRPLADYRLRRRSQQPDYTMADFTPSTVPGCRAPHLWLADGRSLYDALGRATRCCGRDRSTILEALEAATRVSGVPLTLIDLECAADATKLYDRRLVLCAPTSMWLGAATCCPMTWPAWWIRYAAPRRNFRRRCCSQRRPPPQSCS